MQSPLAPESFRRDLEAALPLLRRRAIALAGRTALADDLVQDTMLRALRFQSSYRTGTNFTAWLRTMLQNVFLSYCRRNSVERRVLSQVRPVLDRPEPFREGGLSRTLETAVTSLPEKLRTALVLVDVEECSYAEAAAELSVPVGTVMSRLHRGRAQVRARLGTGVVEQAA
jgi:RNA polymerase sigma-70 factor (ECF subfamily)